MTLSDATMRTYIRKLKCVNVPGFLSFKHLFLYFLVPYRSHSAKASAYYRVGMIFAFTVGKTYDLNLKTLNKPKQMNKMILIRYMTGLGICLLTVLLRLALAPLLGYQAPFLLFQAAVFCVAWFCGLGPGLAAVVFCCLAGEYLPLPFHPAASHPDVRFLLQMLLFAVPSVIIVGLVESKQRSHVRITRMSQRFGNILEVIPSGVIVISSDGYIESANDAAARLFGLTASHMVGRRHDDAGWHLYSSPQEAARPASLPFQQVMVSGQSIPVGMLWVEGPGGGRVALTGGAAPVRDRNGKLTGVVVTLNPVETVPTNSPIGLMMEEPVSESHSGENAIPILYLDHTARLSGGEIALVRLLSSVDRSKIHPIVLLAEQGPLVERLTDSGIETHVLPLSARVKDVRKDTLGFGSVGKLGAALSVLVYAVRVARFARQHHIRLIHTNSLKADLYGGVAGLLARIPVVWHVRDHINPSYLPMPVVRVFRLLARRLPSYVITNSESTREQLHLSGRRPSSVVASGLDFRNSVVHDGLTHGEYNDDIAVTSPQDVSTTLRIGIVGRLASWKGQHIFLEAAEKLAARGRQAQYVIIGSAMFGEDAYEADLRRMADRETLQGAVTFLGFQKDVAACLRKLDILVHASTTPEPFGQVVIEGMAEGLPVVATNGGGVREIVTDGENGLLVPMGDSEALAEALERLIADPTEARRMGQAAYRHVRQNFTSEQSARRVEKIYQEVLGV
jgi:PAS domain S-box-containing protein